MSERRPYLRSASLEKIRCSAYYSIQLAGEFDEIDGFFARILWCGFFFILLLPVFNCLPASNTFFTI